MTESQLETAAAPARGSRLRRRSTLVGIGGLGVAGVVGGLLVGAGTFASAADTSPTFSSDLSLCANPPVAAPAVPLYQTRFTVGAGKVSGVIPAPTATQLAALGITPTLVNVSVTTQYNTGRSGGNKTDVVTVNLPGHQYTNPLLFNIPPVVNSEIVGLGTVAYSAVTTGNAFATVTVVENVVQATSTTPAVVNGTTCPAGETKTGYLQTNAIARPTPTSSSSATPTSSASPSASATATATATATAAPTSTGIVPIP